MTDPDVRRKIRRERLRLAASMCQTLAIGVVVVIVIPSVLGPTADGANLPWPNFVASAVVVGLLVSYAHILVGAAVRTEAWTV
jgi:hypothetical protein